MSNDLESTKKKGHPFLVFLLGLAIGATGAVIAPRYLPEGPWKGSSIQGVVLEKERQEDRLRMRISTDQGLMLATFSQQQDDIDLLVQSGDQVRLRVPAFEPFVADPVIENVMRPSLEEGAPAASADSRKTYVEGLESQLAQWDAEIARLRRRAEAVSGEAQAASQQILESLEAKSRDARERLVGLQQATGNAWEELKAGAERAWAELDGELAEAEQEIGGPPEKPPEGGPTTKPPPASPEPPEADEPERAAPPGTEHQGPEGGDGATASGTEGVAPP